MPPTTDDFGADGIMHEQQAAPARDCRSVSWTLDCMARSAGRELDQAQDAVRRQLDLMRHFQGRR